LCIFSSIFGTVSDGKGPNLLQEPGRGKMSEKSLCCPGGPPLKQFNSDPGKVLTLFYFDLKNGVLCPNPQSSETLGLAHPLGFASISREI
jgi:hypothetical protein